MSAPASTGPAKTGSAKGELAIDVRGLVKRFGNRVAVDGVDIRMPKGEVWGFLGPNGSGKTTTIRMICGLLRPTAGAGHALGFDILREADEIKRRTGYMTQKFSFWEDLTVRENLQFVARLYELPDMAGVVEATLKSLGLASRQDQLAGALSGGWKQRLALGAVTMHQPQLLLLDEPTAGVDPQARRDFWDEIHKLSEAGVTVLVSTHYMDEAERCDRIVYLAFGRVIVQGTVQEVIARSGLVTFRGRGPGVRHAAARLRRAPGVEQASYFGAALHVSGRDREALTRAIAALGQDGITWEEVEPSLEDAFIALMARSGADRRVVA